MTAMADVTGSGLTRNYGDSLSIRIQGSAGSGVGSSGLRNRKNKLRRPLPVSLPLLCGKQEFEQEVLQHNLSETDRHR